MATATRQPGSNGTVVFSALGISGNNSSYVTLECTIASGVQIVSYRWDD